MWLEFDPRSQVWPGLGIVHLLCVVLLAAVCFLLKPKGALKDAEEEKGPTSGSVPRRAPALPSASGIRLREDPVLAALPRGVDERGEPNTNDFPNYTHVQGILHRGDERGFIVDNPEDPYSFDNDNCSGLYLPMFRPTVEKRMDRQGEWPYFDHFKGRKRLWEHRFQFKFKVPIEGEGGIRFGIMLGDYVPLNVVSKRSMKLVVAALRSVVGQDLYHSPGEPSKAGEETELPTFVMPLWAYDQVIETPEGEAPPALDDPHFPDFGMKRTDDRAAFIEYLSRLEVKPGPTYTFAFWGISQFMDCHDWSISGVLPMRIDFNTFCGRPPVTMCVYTLNPGSLTEKDQRHLESRKRYYFKVDFWSSKKPPPKDDIVARFPNMENLEKPLASGARQRRWCSSLECCTVQGRRTD